VELTGGWRYEFPLAYGWKSRRPEHDAPVTLMPVNEGPGVNARGSLVFSVDWSFLVFYWGAQAARVSRSRRTFSEPKPEHHMA
jgi:hypothetical protein